MTRQKFIFIQILVDQELYVCNIKYNIEISNNKVNVLNHKSYVAFFFKGLAYSQSQNNVIKYTK